MSIPIDKLYHYINQVAKDVFGDIIIYRFYPHGSKNINDLTMLTPSTVYNIYNTPHLYCYDQEPLDFLAYENVLPLINVPFAKLSKKYNYALPWTNLEISCSIYNHRVLLHSEKRSANLELYKDNNFIPCYYWSHAFIALDWYRYASHDVFKKSSSKTFLIYNRAWSGSREYRLKFIDLLISSNLVDYCQTTVNPVEPELNIHYSEHKYIDLKWRPVNCLEKSIPNTQAPSWASADYDINDYNGTDIEVVLETLFDDNRIQLTEKILRPIACKQPFILATSHGGLEYLQSYGFKTFNSVIDETYDDIEDPVLRLESIVNTMKTISEWTDDERIIKLKQLNEIAEYNHNYFFSDKFFNLITAELKSNIQTAFQSLINQHTSSIFLARFQTIINHEEINEFVHSILSPEEVDTLLQKASGYSK